MTEFALSPSLEIRDVEEVRARLLAALNGGPELRIDVSPVVAADTAGVQLLIALRREAKLRNVRLEFAGESAMLRQILANLGLAAMEMAA